MISADYSKALSSGSHGKDTLVSLDDVTKKLLGMTYINAVKEVAKDYKGKYGDLLSIVTSKVPLFNGDKEKITKFGAKDKDLEEPELHKIAALGKLYNAEIITNDMMQKIVSSGYRIDKWVRFGKSRGLYKSIKLPKYLMGYARIKQDPKPSQKLMGFTNFLWSSLESGVLRPPSNFIRIANSYYRTLAKKTDRSPLNVNDLKKVVEALDVTNPGLFNAYIEYSTAGQEYRKKLKEASRLNQVAKTKIIERARTEYATIEQAFGGFASTLDAIQQVIPSKTKVTTESFNKLGKLVDPKPKSIPYGKISYLTAQTGPGGVNAVGYAKMGSDDTIDTVKSKIITGSLVAGKTGYNLTPGTKAFEERIQDLQQTMASSTVSKADYNKLVDEYKALQTKAQALAQAQAQGQPLAGK